MCAVAGALPHGVMSWWNVGTTTLVCDVLPVGTGCHGNLPTGSGGLQVANGDPTTGSGSRLSPKTPLHVAWSTGGNLTMP